MASTLLARPSAVDEKQRPPHDLESGFAVHSRPTHDGRSSSPSKSPQRPRGLCGWGDAAVILCSEQFGMATANMVYCFAKFGLWAGVLAILWCQAVSYFGNKTMWHFCMRHSQIKNMDSFAGALFDGKTMGSRAMRVGVARAFDANAISVMSFHVLATGQIIDAVSKNVWKAGCTNLGLYAVAAGVCLLMSLASAGRRLSWIAGVSVVSTIVGFILLLTDLSTQFPPDLPQLTDVYGGIPAHKVSDYIIAFLNVSFPLSVANTVPAVVSEMRKPKDFMKAVQVSAGTSTVLYIVIGVASHYIAGDYNGPIFDKLSGCAISYVAVICFLPTVVCLGSLYASFLNISVIYRFDCLRARYEALQPVDPDTPARRRIKACQRVALRLMVATPLWGIAWNLCQLVPFFDLLTAFVAALFNSLFGYALPAVTAVKCIPEGVHPNVKQALRIFAGMFLVMAFVILVGGVTSGVFSLLESFKKNGIARPYACNV